jgi:hypothetical protein
MPAKNTNSPIVRISKRAKQLRDRGDTRPWKTLIKYASQEYRDGKL